MKKRKYLTPTVLKLGLISFLSDIASEMLYPIAPIFLTTVIGAYLVDSKNRATGLGVFGFLWDFWGSQCTFIYGAIGSIAGCAFFLN